MLIIRQEFRLAWKLMTCQKTTLNNLCEQLEYQGLIQERIYEEQSSRHAHGILRVRENIVHEPLQNITVTKSLGYKKIHFQDGGRIKAIESPWHNVKVENYVILSGKDRSKIDSTNVIGLDIYDDGNLKITNLEFVNCVFVNEFDRSVENAGDGFDFHFEKFEDSTIEFKNCVLWDTAIFITQKSGPSDGFLKIPCVRFVNTFSTSYYGAISVNTVLDDRRYDIQDPSLVGDEIMSFCNTTIDNCQFDLVLLSGFNLSFKGKNLINALSVTNPSHTYVLEDGTAKVARLDNLEDQEGYQVYWGPYQTMVPFEKNWESHKAWLLELKAIAEKKGDYSQRDIFNREIMKCDRELIRQEPWLTSWQDRLTLWFNATFSNYGISWIRPLALLASVNFLYSLLIVHAAPDGCCSADWELLHVFLESFNPLYTPELLDKDGKSCVSALLLGAGLLHKLFFAICVYEIIRAARRFSRQ